VTVVLILVSALALVMVTERRRVERVRIGRVLNVEFSTARTPDEGLSDIEEGASRRQAR
jgi:hypothetical protein